MSESNTPNYVTELQFGQTVYTLEDENAVRYNQGSGNAGKILGIDDDGSVIPVDQDSIFSVQNGKVCITYQKEVEE